MFVVSCTPQPSTTNEPPPPTTVHVDASATTVVLPTSPSASVSTPRAASTPISSAIPIASAAPIPASPNPPRLGSIGRRTYIFSNKNKKVELGIIRPGTSVALRSQEPEPGGDCKSGLWYAVEPTGYVCKDLNTTTDFDSELYRALAALAPKDEAIPFGYGYSTGAPMYGKIPTAGEVKKSERKYQAIERLRLPKKPSGHMELASQELPQITGEIPSFLQAHRQAPLMPWQQDGLVRKTIREGNLLSFQGVVADETGRRYLLATNMTIVPADRIWTFRPTSFHGVELNDANPAPLAWTRRQERARFIKKEGRFTEGGTIPPRTALWLSGKQEEMGGTDYWELRDGSGWVRADQVSIVEIPKEVPQGLGDNERWIDISLSAGTLSMLEGKKIIYSTLMSPGAGGTTQSAKLTIPELLAGAFSPLGLYRVSYKYRSAVMTPEEGPDPEKTWIDDVPYTVYFRPPYAIHTAYWHEDFGHPKSGGCINVSPIDARRIFGWTEPRVPEGWYGASNRLPGQPGTWINIRK